MINAGEVHLSVFSSAGGWEIPHLIIHVFPRVSQLGDLPASHCWIPEDIFYIESQNLSEVIKQSKLGS